MIDPAPLCPLHRKSMIQMDITDDTHYRCCKTDCIVHWDPSISFFYLKTKGTWPVHETEPPV